jgi:hypothetical protein
MMRSRIDTISERLVEHVARSAAGISVSFEKITYIVGSKRAQYVYNLVEDLGKRIALLQANGVLYCGLCKKGPFTRRGLYLHLVRRHRYDIKQLIVNAIATEEE